MLTDIDQEQLPAEQNVPVREMHRRAAHVQHRALQLRQRLEGAVHEQHGQLRKVELHFVRVAPERFHQVLDALVALCGVQPEHELSGQS